ncbi:MOSC domain-containing protein [Streptomyces sp. NRRL B-24484]|uniref:MOSC domain-containing protein n=1 Tax=Streptomyces sp. NRRL B-24484 TaxID=1463833 RepID=UPI0004C02DCE|nr:MOSC N-terminal beta barrel domain-containing protein [Streptomyces sp. NRRL B-24484]
MPQLTALHVYPVKSTYRLSPDTAGVEPWGLAGDRRWMLANPAGRAVTQRDDPSLGQYRTLPHPDGSLTVTAPDGASVHVPAPSTAAGDPAAQADVFGTFFPAVEAAKEAQVWFGDRLGDVRLLHLEDPAGSRRIDPEYARPGETTSMADGFPLLLATTASLASLNEHLAADHPAGDRRAEPLPMERFRPNLVVSGTEAWAEDGWRRIRVGEVVFRVAKPCGRCVVTTTDQETGERRGPEPLLSLGRHRRFGKQLVFGQNLVPERPEGVTGSLLGTLRVGDEVTVLEEGPRPQPDARR